MDREFIIQALRNIGVRPGMTLEVHGSLSAFGHVDGGAETVVGALNQSVGASGSIFMPALRLSRELPLTDADRTLGIVTKIAILPEDCAETAMGAIADAFRARPDVLTGRGVFRTSGWGAHAREAADDGLTYALKNGGKGLLLGVDIYKLTAMHYVEHLLPADIRAIFAPDDEVNRLYPPDRWLIETGRPPVKAWYTIQRMARERGLIRDARIGPCPVMFFDLWDVVGLYESELRRDPHGLYGLR